MSSDDTASSGTRSRSALRSSLVRHRWSWIAGALGAGSVAAVLAWSSADHFTADEQALLARVRANAVSAAYITENDIPDSYLVHLGHLGCGSDEDLATFTARLSEDLAAHGMGDVRGFSVGMMVATDGAKILCPPQ